ncbi:MAG: histone H1 [Bacteroidetes bacterium]|nr:histone H1 [Bacteroidota bacterium]
MKEEQQNFEKLNDKLNSLKEEFEKFYNKNNKAAGTRIRKGMQELKVLAQEIRVDVQNRKMK